jgi:hypothetical protein
MADVLSIALSSTLMDDGNYFNYYNGDDLDLPCGIYYLTVDVGGEIWYSDLFKITDISGQSTIPEIKYKPHHLALPIYDNIYKQQRYRCDDCCEQMLINPMFEITPFFTDDVDFADSSEVHVYLVDMYTLAEQEITAELNLQFGLNEYIYSPGGTFLTPFDCGVYYLRINILSGNWYSETFKIKNIEGIDLTPATSDEIITEDTEINITTEDEINIITG